MDSGTSSTQSSPRLSFREAKRECENFDHAPQGEEVSIREDTFNRRHGEGDQPEVLDPAHPLMRRFQTALKAHLERQYYRLNEEVLELVCFKLIIGMTLSGRRFPFVTFFVNYRNVNSLAAEWALVPYTGQNCFPVGIEPVLHPTVRFKTARLKPYFLNLSSVISICSTISK